MAGVTVDSVLAQAGTGSYQRRLLGIFGLVWAADAMQVLAIGFTAPSIAVTFGLTVPQALMTGTLFFAGMLVGAFVFGRIADRIGRRKVLLATVAIDAVFGIASAFAPDFTWLLVLRFLTGIGVGGTLPVDYAMMAEFLPANRRGRWLVILEGFWAVGTVAVALASLFAVWLGVESPWRVIFFLTGAPALIGLALRFWIPESPLYLLRTGREEEARAVLSEIARVNGRPVDVPKLEAMPQGRVPASAILTGALRRRTVLILVTWLFVSASYYGIFVWLPAQLAGQGLGFVRGQAFLVLVALAQLPGYALAAYGVEKWGRRPTLIGFLLLSAAGCALYGFSADPLYVAVTMLLMSFSLLGTWGALYAFTPELYPTALRATGMGSAGAMARVGGLLAPSVLAPIMAASFAAALGAFAGLLVLAALAVYAIDVEMRDRPLA